MNLLSSEKLNELISRYENGEPLEASDLELFPAMFVPDFVESEEPGEKVIQGMDSVLYHNYENSDFVYFLTPNTFIPLVIADIFPEEMSVHIDYLKDMTQQSGPGFLFSVNNFPIRKEEPCMYDCRSGLLVIDNQNSNKVFSRLSLQGFVKKGSVLRLGMPDGGINGNLMFLDNEERFIFTPIHIERKISEKSKFNMSLTKEITSVALGVHNPALGYVIPTIDLLKGLWDANRSSEIDKDLIRLIAFSSDKHSVAIRLGEAIDASPEIIKNMAVSLDLRAEIIRIKKIVKSKAEDLSKYNGDILYEIANKASEYIEAGVCDDDDIAYIRAYYYLTKSGSE